MPLIKSGTDEAREKNIETLIKEGKDPDQAAAIAYDIQRRHKNMREEKLARGNKRYGKE